MNNLANILKEKNIHRCEKIYISPDISAKKLEGAMSSYGNTIRKEDVVALIDDTVFGGAKENALVTNTALFFKEIFTEPRRFLFEEINSIKVEGKAVFVNGIKAASFTCPEKSDLFLLFSILENFLELKINSNQADTKELLESPTEIAESEDCENPKHPKNLPIALQELPNDGLFQAIKKINSLDNVASVASRFLTDEKDSHSKVTKSFQSFLCRCVTLFREEMRKNTGDKFFENDIATLEIIGSISAYLSAMMVCRGIPENVVNMVILEGIKAAYSISGAVQKDPMGAVTLKLIGIYIEESSEEPESIFDVLAIRLLGSNLNKKMSPEYNFDELLKNTDQQIAFERFVAYIENGFIAFRNKTINESDNLVDIVYGLVFRR